ncbi:MAG: DNA-binding protein [Methylococcales bacterium]|nr:DNA-binding protein [Methylococcales bacterium]
MARIGVTYEQVAEIADAIVGQGLQPGVRNIRERLTTGSPNTIQRHLDTWRQARPKAAAKAMELPATLTAAIASEIEKAAASARSEIEGRLVQAQDDAAELAAAGEQLEDERDDLLNQLTIVTTDRDQATATAAERATEIERMTAELARERHAAEQARIEVAQGRNKQEASDEKLKEQKEEIARLRQLVEQLQATKQAAEQAAAVANAKLEGMIDRANRAEARIDQLEKQQEANTKELNSARNQITSQQIALDAASREADTLKTQLKEAKADAKKAEGEASELRGQVTALTTQLKNKPKPGKSDPS